MVVPLQYRLDPHPSPRTLIRVGSRTATRAQAATGHVPYDGGFETDKKRDGQGRSAHARHEDAATRFSDRHEPRLIPSGYLTR